MVIGIEVYPNTLLKIPYILRDLEENLLSETNWQNDSNDSITFRLYINKDRFFIQDGDLVEYTETINKVSQTGKKVNFINSLNLFQADDIGKVFTPQVTVLRNGSIVDDEELPKSQLRLTVGKPSRLNDV